MKQTLLCLTLINFSIYIVCGATTNSLCGGNNWFPYEDEKCFKLIKKWVTLHQAEETCNQQYLQTDSSVPTLVSIKPAAEQEYLTKFVFHTSGVKTNVWIGAKRMKNGNQFVWDDGSVLDFTNWAEGSPSGEIGRDCVEMQSSLTRKFSNISDSNLHGLNGKWKDVTCESGNYVLCQKNQTWSFLQLQKTLLDVRRELSNTRNQLHNTENKVEDLQRNPVPIGFIYAQLPGQPEPKSLWPTVEWGDVSLDYAGHFFRVVGGNAALFGQSQLDAFQGHHHKVSYYLFNACGGNCGAAWVDASYASTVGARDPVNDGKMVSHGRQVKHDL